MNSRIIRLVEIGNPKSVIGPGIAQIPDRQRRGRGDSQCLGWNHRFGFGLFQIVGFVGINIIVISGSCAAVCLGTGIGCKKVPPQIKGTGAD